MPCCSYPLCEHSDELEDKGFDTACFLQSEGFCVKPVHKELVEVAYECLHQQAVQFRSRVEIIAFARVRCIDRIARGQSPIYLSKLYRNCMCEEWGAARDGALGGSSRPPRSFLCRNRRLTGNRQSHCTDNRMKCNITPALYR